MARRITGHAGLVRLSGLGVRYCVRTSILAGC